MRRNQDNSPVSQTCPIIDNIIHEIDYVCRHGLSVTSSLQKELEKKLNEVRNANLKLRDWGNEECLKVFELNNDLDYAHEQVRVLEDKIKSIELENAILTKGL